MWREQDRTGPESAANERSVLFLNLNLFLNLEDLAGASSCLVLCAHTSDCHHEPKE